MAGERVSIEEQLDNADELGDGLHGLLPNIGDDDLPGCPHCRDRLSLALADDYECRLCGGVWECGDGLIRVPTNERGDD